MRVQDVMTSEVACCDENQSLSAAAQVMWEKDCGCVPITEGGRLLGMITDRDICMAAYTKGLSLSQIPIGDVMSRPVISVGPKDSIEAAERAMREHQVRRLVVLDGQRLVGLVSLNDLTRATGRGRDSIPAEDVASTLAAISTHRTADAPRRQRAMT